MHCWLIGSYSVWRKFRWTSFWWRYSYLSSTPKDWSTEKSTFIHQSVPSRGRRLPAATLPRQPERGRGGRRRGNPGRGGTGRGAPPTYTRTVGNPLTDPTFRAQLSCLIQGEIEQVTGRTPWNNNRDNVPTARITGNRLNPVVAAHEHHVNRVVPEDHAARPGNRVEIEGAPQTGRTDTRTLILNFLIALVIVNFMLNILILRHILNIRFL